MRLSLAVWLFPALLATMPAAAQNLGMSFDEAAYVTCRQAEAMSPDRRVGFTLALVQRAAGHYGVSIDEGTTAAAQLGTLLRSGCTTFPDAFVQSVIGLGVRRVAGLTSQSAPPNPPLPFETAAYLTCEQFGQMDDAQQDIVEFDLAVHAGRRYGMRFGDTPADRAKFDDGITPITYGACILMPELYVYQVVARAVQAAAEKARGAR